VSLLRQPGRAMRLGVTGRIVLLDAFLIALAAALLLGHVRHLGQLPGAPFELPWWTLAIGFYLCERVVVHLHLRGEAHTVSLGELPLALGLFFASPLALLAGQLAGDAVALVVHRRQPPLKLAFNLAQYSVGTLLAAALFRALAGDVEDIDNGALLAALAGVLVATAVGIAAIQTAIAISVQGLRLREVGQALGFGLVASAATGSLALYAVALLWADPAAGWVLAVPVITLWAAYSAYGRLREHHGRLQRLFRTSQVMHDGQDVESSLLGLLDEASGMFHADRAAVLICDALGSGALRTATGPEGVIAVMEQVPLEAGALPWSAAVAAEQPVLVREAATLDALAEHLGGVELGEAMLAPLRGETRMIGFMLLARRHTSVRTYGGDDLKLVRTVAHMAGAMLERGRLERNLRELAVTREQLRHEVAHDALTGLPNRRVLVERLAQALEARRGSAAAPAVLFVDLDEFKQVNDTAGHHAGDELLCAVAERLRGALRADDVAARLGGDEFAVLLPALTAPDEAFLVAGRILAALSEPIVIEGDRCHIGGSVGVALAGEHDSVADLLRKADLAMYDAKEAGGRRIALFRDELADAAQQRADLADALRHALEHDELDLAFQPILGLESGRIVAAEALVRWHHPVRGRIMPAQFIPAAERTGLIVPLGRWVLARACREAKRWASERPQGPPVAVSVNVSARQLTDGSLVLDVANALRASGLEPGSLVLEITESVVAADAGAALENLLALERLGVAIALDDFGNGYSALGYLTQLPLDIVKIDRSIIASVADGGQGALLARAVVSLAHGLDLRVVAGGIEREEQLAACRSLGVDTVQGFLLGRPSAGEDIEARIVGEAGGAAAPLDTVDAPRS